MPQATACADAPANKVAGHQDKILACNVLILGAGPCGLGAAWEVEKLRKKGRSETYLLVDGSPTIGGSAASVTTSEGFVFDYGGHILYPHEEYGEFIDLLDDLVGEWHESKPVRGVWLDQRLIPYPVQRNIHHLPWRKFISAFKGLGGVSLKRRLGAANRGRLDNLDSHLRARFGGGLVKHVLGPINRKMWALDPLLLGSAWMGHRSGSSMPNVPDVSVWQTLRSVITRRDNLGWNETTRVRYPAHGGTGAIWSGVARRLSANSMLIGTSVVGINAASRLVTLSDGRLVRYGSLISSIPLDRLLNLLAVNPVPELKGKLRCSNAAFVGLGFRGEAPTGLDGVHSFHMPESDIPCWRLNFPKNLSPGNVPAGPYWSILCEISHSSGVEYDVERAEKVIVAQLRRRGIIPQGNILVSRWHASMLHGYPQPFLGRDEILQTVQEALRELSIFSRGRFGGWKYEVSNQDHSFMQGVEAVQAILQGRTETTYRLAAS